MPRLDINPNWNAVRDGVEVEVPSNLDHEKRVFIQIQIGPNHNPEDPMSSMYSKLCAAVGKHIGEHAVDGNYNE